jgi:membrane-bound ClpP family serine protease
VILAAVALLLVALAFIAAEIFLPSHGILAVFAALSALAGIILAFKVTPALGLLATLIVLGAIPFVFYWTIKIYPKTPVGKRVLLSEPGAAANISFEQESARLAQFVGQRGVAVTTLRPAGSVEIAGQRIDALSESEIIEINTPVEVARVSGLKVFVKSLS